MFLQLFTTFSKQNNYLLLSYFIVFIIISILISFWYYQRVGRQAYILKAIPALPRYPFLGNLNFITNGLLKPLPPMTTTLILQGTYGFTKLFPEIYVFWMGWNPLVVIFKPEYVESILTSNELIEKSYNYEYLHPWLGKGLLTNTGNQWRSRRKLLTPAFHFRIIDDFIPIMNEQSLTLVQRLKQTIGSTIDDILPYITSCTLDIICDTAMGVNLNAQKDNNSEYVKAVNLLGESFMYRNLHFTGWFDFVFFRTQYGKNYLRSLEFLHRFTRKVIRDRKQEIIARKTEMGSDFNNSDSVLGIKKRMAFLDLLLETHLSDESKLSEEDIREEVDTFMFEGHDTTAMAIAWSLHLIGLDSEVQEKVHEEIDTVFGDDRTRPVNSDDLKSLKYLECCIKEALRLFPSVPAIARLVNNDYQLGSYQIPKGSTFFIYPYAMHRDPDVFPEPEFYKPERFLSNEKRNPFIYIPFSAGPRNCIGQRFALTEEKIVLVNVFRNFRVQSVDQRDAIKASIELVIRPKDPIRMRFYER